MKEFRTERAHAVLSWAERASGARATGAGAGVGSACDEQAARTRTKTKRDLTSELQRLARSVP
jgi:hypothetical protein